MPLLQVGKFMMCTLILVTDEYTETMVKPAQSSLFDWVFSFTLFSKNILELIGGDFYG